MTVEQYMERVTAGGGKRPPPAAAAAPSAKRHRGDDAQVVEDSRLVAPHPAVAFIQDRVSVKACGHCRECKKPVCGVCRACELNKTLTPERLKRDKRRCVKLKCIHTMSDRGSEGPDPSDITAELAQVSEDLSVVSASRGRQDFDEKRYDRLLERKRVLCSELQDARSRRKSSKARFPVGFKDAWGVIANMEKARIKFAKFIVKQTHSESCRTLKSKRQLRDELDGMIVQLVTRFGEMLAPTDETREFWALANVGRVPDSDTEICVEDVSSSSDSD